MTTISKISINRRQIDRETKNKQQGKEYL